ncbi:helix-turn-helix domain-containing protein [Candidatus Woesearchaeota archaeon]|nr:helix-turn-helix domain-containing protein [Candidatus Woesearchaeota archaeon]
MEVTEQIQVFQQFLEIHYLADLLEAVRKGDNFFPVDFIALSKHSPELAELLLDQPEEVIKACELSITNFDLPKEVKQFHLRFHNLPEKHKIFVRNIRSEHLNKFLVVDGTIRQKSDVRPQVTSARFECPSCGNVMNVLQLDTKFKEPSRCGCGRKGKFRLLSKELIDVQGIVLEEATKDLEGGAQPKRINVLLKQDLVSPMSDKRTNPGTSIQIVGILKEIPIILRSGGQSIKYDLLLEANNIIPLEDDYSLIQVSPEEEEEIKKLAADPKISQKLAAALAPGIYGHNRIKEALILQFVGGVKKLRDDGVMSRGDIHILLIGDPGAGKTVHRDTKILFADGSYKKIGEFIDKNFVGNKEECQYIGQSSIGIDEIGKQRKMPIVRLWKRKPEQLYKIKTRTGKEIIGTATNPLFICVPGAIQVKKTKEIKAGDYLAFPRTVNPITTEQKIKISGRQQKINAEIARFFAYALSESYCIYSPEKKRYCIEFVNTEKKLLDDFAFLAYTYFGKKPHFYSKKYSEAKKLVLQGKEIMEQLYKESPSIFGNSFTKQIPDFIMKSPDYVVSSFLSAFFECDGYVEKNHGIGITLASKEMIEQLDILLLRFGIVSRIKSVEKYAANTIKKTKRTYWKLICYGKNARIFNEEIGFMTQRKKTSLEQTIRRDENTNVDIVPHLSFILQEVREKLQLTQFQMGIPRTTYQHLERGDRNPSRETLNFIVAALKKRVAALLLLMQNPEKNSVLHNRATFHASQEEFGEFVNCSQGLVSQYEMNKIKKQENFDYTIFKQKVYNILDDEKLLRTLNNLALLAEADIYWDEIVSIEKYDQKTDFIYDIEVEGIHNFIGNGIFIHNSQLLKRAAVVAPKARFVSGKGVSGAGLCVSPHSLLMTNPGGIETIERIIEPRLKNPQEIQEDVWKQGDIRDIKIQSLTQNLKIRSLAPEALWKLKAPEIVYEITLSSGKKIEVTGNTQLLTIKNGAPLWKKSMDIQEADYIATPRILLGGNITRQETIDLISANPVIHDVKEFVSLLTKKLKEKYGNLRIAAKKLQVPENNLYFHWVNKKARGNIKLLSLKKLAEDLNIPWKHEAKTVSLYNGKKHKIPHVLDGDFLYAAALIAGDGDIRKSGKTYSIRLSNNNPMLHAYFKQVLEKQFALHFDVRKGNSKRPTATRTHSKILAQILFSLGIPESPKSHKIYVSETLLHFSNSLLAHYIAGLYDTDGSVVIRKTKGSDVIDLTTCSETLARQLQLVLLRFHIRAQIRKRKPSTGKIKGKYDKWILEIRGIEEIKKFAEQIPLRHPEKKKKLSVLHKKQIKKNTNLDIIPTLPQRLKQIFLKKNLSLKRYKWRKNLSRFAIQEILNKMKITTEEEKEVKKIAKADIFWERIKEIQRKKPLYKYVYDLTVQDAHNFVVDGVLVHNTAAVVKDEFLSGWSLEAGAMVLANKGILMIDEMDKMTDDDRSAMHEGLEQQSFHHDTLFQFADGSEMKIGDFVEDTFKKHPEKIINGKDCMILQLDCFEKNILTTDWTNIKEGKIDRISKHIAPSYFIEITSGNGRSIVVTPEHPVYCIENAKILTKRADQLTEKDWIPVPLLSPIGGEEQQLAVSPTEIYNERASQHIAVPTHNDKNFFKIIGYMLSEGSKEINRGKMIGINFTNNDEKLIADFKTAMVLFFNLEPYLQKTKKTGENWWMARYVSTELTKFLDQTVPEILQPAAKKEIPQLCMKGTKENIAAMLSCMFEGDGHVSKKTRTIRVGYASNSKRMCEQVQDLLLRFGIRSNLTEHKDSYKVSITGYENILRFSYSINFVSERKKAVVKQYLEKEYIPRTVKDVIQNLHSLAFGDIGFERVRKIGRIENKNQQWTYDITIEPIHTFISQNMILHNTVSISKANIQATLRCETTVLAAANPKLGRFDPYEPIAKQIDMPPALINRFDLIFSIKDLPDKEKDEKLAHFILSLHKKHVTEEVEIGTDMLRKYLIYARQKIMPRLSDEALEELKEYYVKMRSSGNSEEKGMQSIPISPRQLEALVRLSEACAKVRLAEKITRKDARNAINLLHYCLEQIGLDPETGKIDIDRISTGITTSERAKIVGVREIIHELEQKLGNKMIPTEEVIKIALEKGLTEEKVLESIEKLKRSGDIFEPRKGHISRI